MNSDYRSPVKRAQDAQRQEEERRESTEGGEGSSGALTRNLSKKARRPNEQPKKWTIYTTTGMWKKIADAVRFLERNDIEVTRNGLVVEAIRRELDRLQEEFNDGETFPKARKRRLSAGRPIRHDG